MGYNAPMNNEPLLDKLERAYQMEEQMAGILIDLCRRDEMSADIPVDVQKRILGILASIKTDTLRHKEIVAEARRRLS
jgi:hypothetical protein